MGSVELMDIESLLAEEHGIYSTRKIMDKLGISKRTVGRRTSQGKLCIAGYVGNMAFFTEEKENPLSDKGEKHTEGSEWDNRWLDPFGLT